MKRKAIIITSLIVITAAIIGVLIWYFRRQFTETGKTIRDRLGLSGSGETSTTVETLTNTGYPIKYGTWNSLEVQLLQTLINPFINPQTDNIEKLLTDGKWGDDTETAVQTYLSKNVFTSEADIRTEIKKMAPQWT